MNKIQRVSLFFRIFFQIVFVALPLFEAIAWSLWPLPQHFFNMIQIDLFPQNIIPENVPLPALTPFTKFFGFLAGMIPTGVELFVLYFLIKLFRLYEKGEIFSINNVNYIRKIGYTMLIGVLIHPLYDALISLTLTWNNPAGMKMRLISISFGSTDVLFILASLLVILISWIMAEGCKLREEQQLTV